MSDNEETFTILVPIDHSAASDRAVAWAVDYAQRSPSDVHLLQLLDQEAPSSDLLSNVAEMDEPNRMTDADVKQKMGPIKRHVARGRPAVEILRLADQLGGDLIVLATDGRTTTHRAVRGSVAEYVVRHAHCTVVCVKPTVQVHELA